MAADKDCTLNGNIKRKLKALEPHKMGFSRIHTIIVRAAQVPSRNITMVKIRMMDSKGRPNA